HRARHGTASVEAPRTTASSVPRREGGWKRAPHGPIEWEGAARSPAEKEATMSGPAARNYLCVTCGTQFRRSEGPPERCPVCEDERQYVGWEGQRWTTLGEMQGKYHNTIREEEPGLHSLHTGPKIGIGQRAFLVRTPQGNLLWDCVPLLDEASAAAVRSLGGVAAVAVSHPHYYTSMVEWSHAFGNVPVHIHRADERWVMRPDP